MRTITTFRCKHCGGMNHINDNAPTHVAIYDAIANNPVDEPPRIKGEYRLGHYLPRDQKVQCLREDGLVARVCFYSDTIEAGWAHLLPPWERHCCSAPTRTSRRQARQSP